MSRRSDQRTLKCIRVPEDGLCCTHKCGLTAYHVLRRDPRHLNPQEVQHQAVGGVGGGAQEVPQVVGKLEALGHGVEVGVGSGKGAQEGVART
jgi:hypothetical protein